MPHERTRHLAAQVRRALKFSPIVGILGQRQTGKTTLMRQLVGDRYVSLDDHEQLDAALASPKSFVSRTGGTFGIDECQLAPGLFSALKLRVQQHPGMGQFLVSGSVRFTSRKAIRESLTGRIFNLELLPMSVAEAKGLPPCDLMKLALGTFPALRTWTARRLGEVGESDVNSYLLTGGLPGICFLRDPAIRRARWGAHLDTLLERDLRLVLQTSLPASTLRQVLVNIARGQGRPASISDLSRQTRVSMPTLNKLIAAFEALFLVRRIVSAGERKRPVLFLEDQGLASYLAESGDPAHDMLRLAFSQLHANLRALYPGDCAIQAYETRGGARVPIVLAAAGKRVGCIPVPAEAADRSALLSARSFAAAYPSARVVILTRGTEAMSLGPRIFALPLRAAI